MFAGGERAGQALAPADLALGGRADLRLAVRAGAKLVRDGSRLNLVRVLRLDAAALSATTAGNAADGIVAYAAMCSHAGCDVLGWNAETHHLVCPCHSSEFDAARRGGGAKGPATKPLAMLPLELRDGELVVARGFTRAVGFKPL